MFEISPKSSVKISKSNLGLYLSLVLIVVLFITGIFDAISKSWTGDDAFISFRYAKNLVVGKGLVYNEGERVEGYTNFLWTMLIALGMKLNMDPIKFTDALGILCFTPTILTFIYVSWRLFGTQNPFGVFIPLTALCLLAHPDFKIFATGGLETSLYTFLVSIGFAGLIFSENKYSYLLTGLIFVLAMMTRPDGFVFYFLSLFFLILTASPIRKRILYFLAPLIIVFIPYFIFRLLYYHYPLPNTYYARSAYLSWWSQGLKYLFLYLKAYYVLLLLPVLGVIAMVKNKDLFRRLTKFPLHFDRIQNSVFLSILFSVVFSIYVIRVGGDFMFARFFIPITPLLYFLMETFAFRVLNKKYLIPFAAIICLSTYFYWYPQEIKSLSNKIVDERYFYPKSRIEEAKEKGGILKRYLKGTDAKVVIFGSQAMLAYYAEFPTVIEGESGLTDEYIAHLPVKERTRPGHEKLAPMDYVFKRGVNFVFAFGLWNPPLPTDFRDIRFGEIRGGIIVYNRDIMNKLKTYDEIKFVDFEKFLDNYIQEIPSAPRSYLLTDYNFFKDYYFNHNSDPIRQNAFISVLGNEGN